MRMKLYSAPTRDQAIKLVYADMGDDAVILSEWQAESAYEVRAGVERATQKAAPPTGVGWWTIYKTMQINCPTKAAKGCSATPCAFWIPRTKATASWSRMPHS